MADGITAVGNQLASIVTGKEAEKNAADKEKDLKKACADFEAILVYSLFKSMRKTVPASGLLTNYPGKDTYTMIMDQKVAEDLAHRGDGLGIQKMLFNQISRKQPQKGDSEP